MSSNRGRKKLKENEISDINLRRKSRSYNVFPEQSNSVQAAANRGNIHTFNVSQNKEEFKESQETKFYSKEKTSGSFKKKGSNLSIKLPKKNSLTSSIISSLKLSPFKVIDVKPGEDGKAMPSDMIRIYLNQHINENEAKKRITLHDNKNNEFKFVKVINDPTPILLFSARKPPEPLSQQKLTLRFKGFKNKYGQNLKFPENPAPFHKVRKMTISNGNRLENLFEYEWTISIVRPSAMRRVRRMLQRAHSRAVTVPPRPASSTRLSSSPPSTSAPPPSSSLSSSLHRTPSKLSSHSVSSHTSSISSVSSLNIDDTAAFRMSLPVLNEETIRALQKHIDAAGWAPRPLPSVPQQNNEDPVSPSSVPANKDTMDIRNDHHRQDDHHISASSFSKSSYPGQQYQHETNIHNDSTPSPSSSSTPVTPSPSSSSSSLSSSRRRSSFLSPLRRLRAFRSGINSARSSAEDSPRRDVFPETPSSPSSSSSPSPSPSSGISRWAT